MDLSPVLKVLAERGDMLGLVVIVLIAGGIWWLRVRPLSGVGSDASQIVRKDVSALAERVGGVEERLARVEEEIEHLPTKDEFHKHELALTRLEGQISTIDQRTTATSRSVARIEDFLLKLATQDNGK